MYQCTVFDDNYAFVYASICMHNPGVVDTYDDGRHSSLNSILYYIYTPKITYIYILYIYVYTVYSLCLSCQVYPCLHSTRPCSGGEDLVNQQLPVRPRKWRKCSRLGKIVYLGVSKNRGILPPKMDGLFHGKPYEQMDDLGVFPLFLETPIFRPFLDMGGSHFFLFNPLIALLAYTNLKP